MPVGLYMPDIDREAGRSPIRASGLNALLASRSHHPEVVSTGFRPDTPELGMKS
jgi:hypothetical protein